MTLRPLTKPIFWAPWFAAAIMSYFFVDRTLTVFIHHLDMSQPWLVTIFSKITHLGNSLIYLVVGGLIFLWAVFIAKNKQFAWIAAYFLLAIIISGIICDVLKCLAGRARPSEFFAQPSYYGFYFWRFHSPFWSFPSGHTTTIASLATAGYLLLRRYLWFFISIIVLVGASRLMVQAHYLSDVMTGAYLGFIISYWLHQLLADKLRATS